MKDLYFEITFWAGATVLLIALLVVLGLLVSRLLTTLSNHYTFLWNVFEYAYYRKHFIPWVVKQKDRHPIGKEYTDKHMKENLEKYLDFTSVVGVLTYVRDKKQWLEKYMFICDSIEEMRQAKLITPQVATRSLELLRKYKPVKGDGHFTIYRYWNKRKQTEGTWWSHNAAKSEGNLPELYEEKRKLLTYIIESIK